MNKQINSFAKQVSSISCVHNSSSTELQLFKAP